MPHIFNRLAIMEESRALMKSGSVSPMKFTLLFVAVNGVLSALTSVVEYSAAIGPRVGFSFLSLSFVGILSYLISTVLTAGYKCFCLGIHRREEMPYDSLFDGFAFAGRCIGLMVLESIYVFCWSMLFFFPGIIATFRYSFAMWNLCDDPDLGVFRALELSKRQTRGYKFQLFLLYLQFLPFYLLVFAVSMLYGTYIYPLLPATLIGAVADALISSVISGCFGIFLMPYVNLSVCGFYLRASGKYGEGGAQQNNRCGEI